MSDRESTWADWDKLFADSIARNEAVIEALGPDPVHNLNGSSVKPLNVPSILEAPIILTHWVVESSGLTACCGRTWTELPLDDRCTLDKTLATCQGTNE